jgi:septation ring formation regulator EzrA
MTGIEMMLKAFGVDAKQLQEQVAPAVKALSEFKTQMMGIQAQLNRIEENQHDIMDRLNIPVMNEPMEDEKNVRRIANGD